LDSSTKTLLELLQRYGTVRDLGEFLRSRGISGGTSWAQLIDDRIKPALKTGALSTETLLVYLRDAEEYGRQHVFLFRHKTGVPSAAVVKSWLKDVGADCVLAASRVLDLPEKPEIAEVRRDPSNRGEILVIKVIERRTYDTLLRVTALDEAGRYSREYQREEARAVNIVRVHPGGLVEFRVNQHKTASRDYDTELAELKAMVRNLLDPMALRPINLVKAKSTLYDKRHDLRNELSFSSTHIRDTDGVSHTSACGGQESLFSFERTEQSIALLTADGGGYHESLNVWWLAKVKARPHQKVHVILSGSDNEFAVTQGCSRGDYEHILGEILRFNN
jgi:hypothetical protein